MQSFFERWKEVFGRVAAIPLVFMGVGIYRAWLATFFRYDAFPTIGVFDYFLFEAAIGIACLALAFFSHKIAPLWSNRLMRRVAEVAMVGGSVLIALSCFVVQMEAMKTVGLIAAGGGLGVLIIMWAEFFGSLSSMRVALYYSLAIFAGELIKWLLLGMDVSYLVFFSIVLPLASFGCVKSSMKKLPSCDIPQKESKQASRVFPLKPVLLMSACTFAGGFGTLPAQTLVAGNFIGVIFICALVFFGVLSVSKWFNFDTVYQLAFPLFIIGFLFVTPSFGANPEIMTVCYEAGYTMLSLFIMIILSSITYRFGISAVWISGLERGIRYIVELLGWGLYALLATYANDGMASLIYTAVVIAMVVLFTTIIFTERGLSAKWGVVATDDPLSQEADSPIYLAMRVTALSRAYALSPREEEVLQLLARRESAAQIEQDLFVSQGTIKAHVNHIYRKFDIHSRTELYALLEKKGPEVS